MADIEKKDKPEKKPVDLSKLAIKKEYESLDYTIHSPHLTRPVSLRNLAGNPKAYLKADAKRHVANNGVGSYPLFKFFDLTEEIIKALAEQ